MDGVIVRLEKDGKVLREYRHPANLKAQWSDSGSVKSTDT
jgi:hypothetical protein